MRIEVDNRHLRAALVCGAKSDIRHYLNGIAIEVHRDRVLIVATDGHRLYIGRCVAPEVIKLADGPDPRDHSTYIVPRSLIERALRALPRKAGSLSVHFDLPDTDTIGKVTLYVAGDGFIGDLIDGKFPDWRRIAGAQRTSREHGQFKPDYIADCQRIANCFAWGPRSNACVDIAHNGPDRAALVTFSTTGDACVFLMPLRSFEARSVYDWLKLETGSIWDREVEQ